MSELTGQLLGSGVGALLLLLGMVMGVVWLVFPFAVLSRLGQMIRYLEAIERHLRPRKDQAPPPAKSPSAQMERDALR